MPIEKETDAIVQKVAEISGIKERRYISQENDAACIAAIAAQRAVNAAQINKEAVDSIIVAHNFGNITSGNRMSHLIPIWQHW